MYCVVENVFWLCSSIRDEVWCVLLNKWYSNSCSNSCSLFTLGSSCKLVCVCNPKKWTSLYCYKYIHLLPLVGLNPTSVIYCWKMKTLWIGHASYPLLYYSLHLFAIIWYYNDIPWRFSFGKQWLFNCAYCSYSRMTTQILVSSRYKTIVSHLCCHAE